MMTPAESDKIYTLLVEKRWNDLRTLLGPIAPEELAPVLAQFGPGERVLIFRCLSREQAGDVFALMDEEQQETLLAAFTDQETMDVHGAHEP